MEKRNAPKTVDEYIGGFPSETQKILKKVRSTIKKAAPKAEERISYGIAGYFENGILIYFAGFKNHVSVYPAPRGEPEFKKELAAFKGGKGTIQFPVDKPIDYDLISRIVKFRQLKKALKSKAKKR
jgi:uncharacterized protein YdhG (YjbR/CyaY superfamily)